MPETTWMANPTSDFALVVDANSVIVRAIYASALDDLKAGGQFTGGVYGALMSLRTIVRELSEQFRITRVIAAFDNGVPEYRTQLLPDYKLARKTRQSILPDEERERAFQQIRTSFDLWPTLGVLCLSYTKREADDVVAAVARRCLLDGRTPIIVSSDRDLWQCVRDGARVFDLRNNRLIDGDNFMEHSDGVPVSTWLLYRALVGDSSDGIAGAAGCGPKRAKQLLSESAPQAHAPIEQLRDLVAVLAAKKDARKFEQAVVAAHEHLVRVLSAIDLSASFGPDRKLVERMRQLPEIEKRSFLQFCKRLGFASVLSDPHAVIGPFEAVAEERKVV